MLYLVNNLLLALSLEKFRNKWLNIDNPSAFGTSQMDDVYFQYAEARNKNYDNIFII